MSHLTRRTLLLAAASAATGARALAQEKRKARGDSVVKRFDVITIGNLSRNRYWGEGDEKGVRAVICTTTLITAERVRVLVDPSLADGEQMAKELDRWGGLEGGAVDALFGTRAPGE